MRAALLLAAIAAAPAGAQTVKSCVRQYQVEYENEAGISYDDWSAACRRGENMQSFYSAHLLAFQRERSVSVVREVLGTPTSQLEPGKVEAFMAVNPQFLPAELQAPYARKRKELASLGNNFSYPDLSSVIQQVDPQAQARADQARITVPKTDDPAVFVKQGWDELLQDENKWLLKATQCTEDQLSNQFLYKVAYETRRFKDQNGKWRKTKIARWFVHRNDPLDALVTRYRQLGGTATIGGTGFFGSKSAGLCSKGDQGSDLR